MKEVALFVERLVSLSNSVVVFLVGSHIYNLVGYSARLLVNLAERSLDKAVFVNLRECCEVGDKSDVRSFRSLDRTHTAVVSIVNVTNLESCAVTGKTAGAERRETSLVSKLRERVVLIHKLRKRR